MHLCFTRGTCIIPCITLFMEFVLHAELVLRIPLHCLEFVFYAAKLNKPV